MDEPYVSSHDLGFPELGFFLPLDVDEGQREFSECAFGYVETHAESFVLMDLTVLLEGFAVDVHFIHRFVDVEGKALGIEAPSLVVDVDLEGRSENPEPDDDGVRGFALPLGPERVVHELEQGVNYVVSREFFGEKGDLLENREDLGEFGRRCNQQP